jgi:hypothetical protein
MVGFFLFSVPSKEIITGSKFPNPKVMECQMRGTLYA